MAEPPPPPPEAERQDKPPRPESHERGGPDRRGGPGSGMPGFSRPPMRHDAFDKLPETEKQRVRSALDKIWGRPEVIEARDKATLANDELRNRIREALTKIDPEAAAILARIEPKDGFDPRNLPKLPPPDSEEYPRVLIQRLGQELMSFTRPDRHEETKALHERVMAKPEVKTALADLQSQQGEGRISAAQKLREVYRAAVGSEFQKTREQRAAGEGEILKP